MSRRSKLSGPRTISARPILSSSTGCPGTRKRIARWLHSFQVVLTPVTPPAQAAMVRHSESRQLSSRSAHPQIFDEPRFWDDFMRLDLQRINQNLPQ